MAVNAAWLIIGVLVYVAQPPAGFFRVFSDTLPVVAAALAIAPTLAGAYYFGPDEPQRKVWFFLGFGLFLWGLGEISWWVLEIVAGLNNPFPSVADVFWLSGYPPLLIGFILSWRRFDLRIKLRTMAAWLVGLGFATAASFIFILLPIVQSNLQVTEKFLDLAYPVGDILILGAASLTLTAFGYGVLSRPWKIITAGFMIILVADLIYSYLSFFEMYKSENRNPIDLLWAAGYLIIGIGALSQIDIFKRPAL